MQRYGKKSYLCGKMRTGWLFLTLVFVAITGCLNHDTYDGEVALPVTDVVTYEGQTPVDSMLFTLRQCDDSPLIRLTCAGHFKNNITPGQRMVLKYVPPEGKPYTSGVITFVSAYLTYGGEPIIGDPKDFPWWKRDEIYVYTLWRSGEYINLNSRYVYTPRPRPLQLLIDSATMGSPVVEAYITHLNDTIVNSHDRTYYHSWNIKDVWERPDLRELKIHVNNSNLPQSEFRFLK